MSRPRLLALMGSGETAPTMARVHRQLVARLGGGAGGALLDTPYGFQENADEITARAVDYFERTVGLRMAVAPLRRADEDPLLRATAIGRLREAGYVFAGPGSPSYALHHWRATEVPGILAEKLERGGIVVFASAAALTLGASTVPVYEIYKVGEEPRWLQGLDLLGPLGLPVAVIPHFDNAEGGTHDTRFCYLGETRLARLERELPEDRFVLGIDSHTAFVLDLEARLVTVTGLGGITVRAAGRSRVIPAGSQVPLDELPRMAAALRVGAEVRSAVAAPTDAVPSPAPEDLGTRTPLMDEASALERRFEDASTAGDRLAAARSVLELEGLLVRWSSDTVGTDEALRARAILQSLIVRLAEDPADAPAPQLSDGLVALLVELRARARAAGDYALGDRIRDALADAGLELRDGPEGTTWRPRAS